VEAILAKRQQDFEAARRFYGLTTPFAEGLRNETEIPLTSYLPESPNGLDASQVQKAYEELGRQLSAAPR